MVYIDSDFLNRENYLNIEKKKQCKKLYQKELNG